MSVMVRKTHNQLSYIHSITQATEPFDMIGMDFLGPLTTTDDGNKHILVFTDYRTRWVEALPTRDQKASTAQNNRSQNRKLGQV